MTNRSSKLVKNTAILTFGTICTKGLMFLMTPLFTRWVSQEVYGTLDLLLTYVSLLLPLITLGFGEALFRFLAGNEVKNKKSVVTISLVVTLIGFALSGILLFFISCFSSTIRNVAVLFYLLLFAETCYNFMTMVLRGIKQLTTYTVANIIYSFSMATLVTLFVKVFGLSLNGIVYGYALGYIISILYMAIKSNVCQYVSLKDLDGKLFIKMCKYAIPMIPNLIAWWIMDASDRTIVSTWLGTGFNAILSVAHKIPNLCQTLFNVFHLSWQENAVETMNDKDRDDYYNQVMNNMLRVLIPISCVVIVFNFFYFDFLFDERYALGYYLTPILILAVIFSMLSSFIGGIYVATLKSYKNGITTMIAAILNIIIHILLITNIGLYASVVSTLISYFVLFIIRYLDIRKTIHLKINTNNFILLGILGYFVVSQYFKIDLLNIINVFLAFFLFYVINKSFLVKILKKLNLIKS